MQGPRRQFLRLAGAYCMLNMLPPSSACATAFDDRDHPLVNQHSARLLAAWQIFQGNPQGAVQGGGHSTYQAGVLQVQPGLQQLFSTVFSVDLPSRPHGLMHLYGQEYLVVARRPGDWLMKLNLNTGATSRLWQQESTRLNGHSASNGLHVYTTETDLLTGEGMLALRDQNTLEVLDLWPTHGHDPHEVIFLPAGALGIDQPFLLVANGGIKTHAEMGRTPLISQGMDSSLVALHPSTGAVLKQWTLGDSTLSLRHLAFHPSGVLAVAMQAQHSDPDSRNSAPVLALLNHNGLHAVSSSAGEQGYGGDVVATSKGFAVSCTRSNRLLNFSLAGELLSARQASAVCALAANGDSVWAGFKPGFESELHPGLNDAHQFELDNHWLLLEG